MASMHGTYRSVEETVPPILLVGEVLAGLNIGTCHWLLDKPVSNSGRLKAKIEELADEYQWRWHVKLSASLDHFLISSKGLVASADSQSWTGLTGGATWQGWWLMQDFQTLGLWIFPADSQPIA
jgi:hypothetical protein